MTDTRSRPDAARQPQGGPPLPLPAAAYAALTVAAVVIGIGTPRPSGSPADALAYYAGNPTVGSVTGMLMFGASIPLAIWTAAVYRRLPRLGVTAPGTAIALVGGLLAAAALAASGLLTWTAVQLAPVGDPAVVKALATLSFAFGATGFAVPFALLLAGVAVPALILGLLPRTLAGAGLVVAAAGVLSTLLLVFAPLVLLIPIVRFGGLAWLLAVAVLLPRTRRRVASSTRAGQPARA